ncbi:NDR1/HIN1-like protein 26 [Salvia hispanica]|uniref:NDR1/HIN1-like protein 26 n=1 Tax=Salvia hispanica TaxID=49212 RepID=UPI0020099642|nr:NDR1/HIN1-like protein 26 [Salvia hispanica]
MAEESPPPPPHGHPTAKMADEKPHHKQKQPPYPPKDPRRALCAAAAILLLLLGSAALALYLIYRPHRPKFRVLSAAAYQLNTSSPPFVTATAQFTVAATNPSRRAAILYDPLSAYVSYRGRAITPAASLPPLLQEPRSTVALSPLLGGAAVPVEAELANALAMDEAYGVVELRLVMAGKMRYKAGALRSRRRGVSIACDLLISLKNGFVGKLTLLGSPPCKVYL